MRFTLDSNVLVRAVISPGGPAFRLLETMSVSHTLVLSCYILDEVQRVLLYPRIQSRYRISVEEAARFTVNVAAVSDLIEPVITRPIIESDPADDPGSTPRSMAMQTFSAH